MLLQTVISRYIFAKNIDIQLVLWSEILIFLLSLHYHLFTFTND